MGLLQKKKKHNYDISIILEDIVISKFSWDTMYIMIYDNALTTKTNFYRTLSDLTHRVISGYKCNLVGISGK